MSIWRGYLVALCFLVSAAGAACTSESPPEVAPEVRELLLKAQNAYENDAFSAALVLSDSAQTYAPEMPEIYFLQGRIYTNLRQFDQARTAYDSVLALDPSYQGARMNLGINAYRQERFREAINHYRQEADRHPTATVHLELGRAYLQIDKFDSARVALRRSLELDSSKATTYMWLGKLYQYSGELEKALQYSRRGLRLDTSKVNYHYLLGSQLVAAGDAREAVPHLRRVADEWPWHPGAHQNLGKALIQLGKPADGRKYLAEVDTLQELEGRIADLREQTKKYPRRSGLWIQLGDALRRSGRLDESFEAYTVASNLDPRNIALQNNLANLRADRGNPEKAIARYRTVLQQDSSLIDVWMNLGVVYANSGQHENARQAWKNVLRIEPEHQMARKYLARLDEMSESSSRP